MSGISTHDLEKESGATYRQLIYWIDQEVVGSELCNMRGRGSGNHLRWNAKAVPVCYVLARLQSGGVKIQTFLLAKIADVLTRAPMEEWPHHLPIPGAEHVVIDLGRLRSAFGREHPERFGELLGANA